MAASTTSESSFSSLRQQSPSICGFLDKIVSFNRREDDGARQRTFVEAVEVASNVWEERLVALEGEYRNGADTTATLPPPVDQPCLRNSKCTCPLCAGAISSGASPAGQPKKNASTSLNREEVLGTLKTIASERPSTEFRVMKVQEQCMRSLLISADQKEGTTLSQAQVVCLLLESGGGGLEMLGRIALGPNDAYRWMAFAVLFMCASFAANAAVTTISSAHEWQLLSDRVYTQLFDMERFVRASEAVRSKWHNSKHVTFSTSCVELTIDEIEMLVQLCKKITAQVTKMTHKELMALLGDEAELVDIDSSQLASIGGPSCKVIYSKIDACWKAMDAARATPSAQHQQPTGQGAGYFPKFAKLSTRSPKDSFMLGARKDVALVRPYLAASEDSSGRHAAAAALALRSASPTDAMWLLMSSNRIADDLEAELNLQRSNHIQQDDDSSSTMSIVLREWWDIPPCLEFRGFVFDNKFTAISQYNADQLYPVFDCSKGNKKSLENDLVDLFTSFFSDSVLPVLQEMGLRNAILDLGLALSSSTPTPSVTMMRDRNQWVPFVIELNSFGTRSGACLFDWDDPQDYALITESCGAPVLRVRSIR